MAKCFLSLLVLGIAVRSPVPLADLTLLVESPRNLPYLLLLVELADGCPVAEFDVLSDTFHHEARFVPSLSWPNALLRRDFDQTGCSMALHGIDTSQAIRESRVQGEPSPALDMQLNADHFCLLNTCTHPCAPRRAGAGQISNGCAVLARTGASGSPSRAWQGTVHMITPYQRNKNAESKPLAHARVTFGAPKKRSNLTPL